MVTQNKLILVSGATGQQGGAVAKALLAKGQKIRVMTRNPDKAAVLAKAGAEVIKGDFMRPADMQAAMRGVHGVFGVTTFFEAGVDAEVKQGIELADAAKQAGIRHFVYTSVGSADRSTGIPHFESKWKVEQHICKIGLPYTILRPVAFMENFLSFWKPSPEGVLTVPMKPEKKLALVALNDIGEYGATAFLRPIEFLGVAINLAGDELTPPMSRRICRRRWGGPFGSSGFRMSRSRPPWVMTWRSCSGGSIRRGTVLIRRPCPRNSAFH